MCDGRPYVRELKLIIIISNNYKLIIIIKLRIIGVDRSVRNFISLEDDPWVHYVLL